MPEPDIVREPISLDELTKLAESGFGDLVKAVVDVGRGILAIGGELWGINLYPSEYGTAGWLEYDSMVNVRPAQGNRTRSVDDESLRRRIDEMVDRLVQSRASTPISQPVAGRP